MKDLGVSLAHFGYYQGVFALVFAMGSVLCGLILKRYKQSSLLGFSTKIYIVSTISVILITALNSFNPLLITLSFLPFVISQIIPSTILYPICLSFMPTAKGKISGVLQGSQLIFSALSLQLAGYFYRGSFQNIGIIISTFILLAVITHLFVIKNREIMKC